MVDIAHVPWGADLPQPLLRKAALNTAAKLREEGWANGEIKEVLGALGLIPMDYFKGPLYGQPVPSWP